ncbi:MAG TPA: CVNH domain-containing protein [Candidatus Elarobacter sp.]|nr:CVNH domain-containing protein [Candidatus Elarobacter sp.]
MPRILFSLLAGLGLAATVLAPASAQSIPSGSYQQSCTNIRVRGDQLTARCTNAQGTAVRSTIALNGCRNGDIVNSNGQLACNRNGNGNGYGNGNDRDNDNGNGNGRRRHRHHRDGDDNNGNNNNGNNNNGGYNNGGYNNGGYNNGRYGNRGAVAGSYQSSCTNVQMSGGTLTATCTSANGSNITSSINPAQCRGGDIANVNGRLACR